MTEETALIAINKQLKEYLQQGYHVPGTTVITNVANFMQPSIRVVQIDTNVKHGEIYPVGGKLAFGRAAIQKFADAGRIELKLPERPVHLEKGKGVERYTARAIGERYELDGAPKRLEDAKTLDLIIREEEMRLKYEKTAEEEHKSWPEDKKKRFVEACLKKVMIEKRKFATESAITGAQGRVVQKMLGLKPVYTLDELKKPFVIVAVTPVVDMEDPDIKRMVTAHMLGIRDQLYPHATEGHRYQPSPAIDVPSEFEGEVVLDEKDICGLESPIPGASAYSSEGEQLEEFGDFPRLVREGIVRQLVRDEGTLEKIGTMGDMELTTLYGELKHAA